MLVPSTVDVERDSPFAVLGTQYQQTDRNTVRIFLLHTHSIFEVFV